MSEARPDPERILEKIREEEALATRGKLKIFFGASAGVGKTCAMLSAAQLQLKQGRDVVIGVLETHGRRETAALAEGLEHLPPEGIVYRDKVLDEFSVSAAIARKPALILIDELAHSNVPGSRHRKRWQDVEEILGAGIDVYSTVNVQHLESLNDVVGGITGIRVNETVPDHVFDAADEVVLVDLPPDELLQRLSEGKVYIPAQAAQAAKSFFRKGNLIALRELALRRTADRVDHQMIQYRRDQAVFPVWQTQESVLACVGPGPDADRIVRSAARIAKKFDVQWHAVYIETPRLQTLSPERRQRILKNLSLAQEMGAQTAVLSGNDAAESILEYARDRNLSRILVGRQTTGRWRPWYRPLADRISQRAPDLEVTMVATEASGTRTEQAADAGGSVWSQFKAPWQSYAMGVLVCAAVALIALPLHSVFDLANIAMLFLLAVLLVAVRYGLGPSVVASFLNVATFDFFYVPPRFSFAVSDVQYLLTFVVMLAVGLVTARLTNGLRYQARVANRREHRVHALYEMSRDLSGVLATDQIAAIARQFAKIEFKSKVRLLLIDDDDHLLDADPHGEMQTPVDMGIARWAFDHDSPAGCGTDTLPASPILYVPLRAPMRTRGVMALEPSSPQRLTSPEQQQLLDTFARLIAISLERLHYVEVAQSTTLQIESERLRNSLLSAISHDLRTPLAALAGLTDTFAIAEPRPAGQQVELLQSVREELVHMTSLVNNLLDMARLQSGTVALNLQWLPMEEVVGSALRSVHSLLHRHRVKTEIAEDLPLVEIDAILVERVLSNLIENAVKYSPPGGTITIGAAVASPTAVELWVEDEGPGLPPGKSETIFNKFERGSKETAIPGVGLGLAICRSIIQAHGGTIRAEAARGGGARFVVSLARGNPPAMDADASLHPGESSNV